jgi:hypothetical protein
MDELLIGGDSTCATNGATILAFAAMMAALACE